jgi:uncharacterized membrane protein
MSSLMNHGTEQQIQKPNRQTDRQIPRQTKNRKGLVGWILIALHVLIEIYAVASYLEGGTYEVNYGLTAIMLFSYAAGAAVFGLRDMIFFNIISAGFAFLFENTSVSFGFPFGFFEHFAAGPRIGNIPVQVGFGYYFYAFAGWLFADLLIGNSGSRAARRIGRPLIGGFIASAMDLTTDAINGMVMGSYDYPEGGGFFGSPLTNSLGWIFTVFVTLLVVEFVIVPRHEKKDAKQPLSETPTVWHLQNVILLGLQVSAPLIGYFLIPDREVTDVTGVVWQSRYAYEASAMVGLLSLGTAMLCGIAVYARRAGGAARNEEK